MLPMTPDTKSKTTGREKTPGRETKSDRFTLSLAVYGSSAPIYNQPPKTYRQEKIHKDLKKETKRNYSFPVEKIILLAERLELTSMREQQFESISYIKAGNRLKEDECNETASGLDFSLDLSSVDAESDDSEGETEENLHYNSASSTKREGGEEPKKGDLVNLYVNSVDNQELTKYFRPCLTCSEPCCVCPEEAMEKSNKAVGAELSTSRLKCENGGRPFDGRRYKSDCRSSYCCPDDFLDDFCTECMCKCESEDVANAKRMLSYANSLANAAKSARVLARDLESVLSSFKGDAE